ncbi:MAG: tRNA pseudouridine(55) synthase TruB [Sphingobium sp.]
MHGWIILDKPHSLGSTQAVAAVKRALRQAGVAKPKVGHGGTLDPLATGVLPIAVGEATKLAGRMLDSDKIYDFTVAFGAQTDTLDLEGKVIATSDRRPTWAELEAVLPRFTGPIEQAPPAYSAILIDGQRAYDLARAGQDVEMKTRYVTIFSLRASAPPREENGFTRRRADAEEIEEISLRAHVSKGTYIRSLARDIAIATGTVGHVTMLRRVKAGLFGLDAAISLDKLRDAATARAIGELMLPLTAGLDDILALPVSPDEALMLRQGKVLIGKPHTGLMLAMQGDTPVALVEVEDGNVRVVRGFNLMSKEDD